jgi:hypothetical protein
LKFETNETKIKKNEKKRNETKIKSSTPLPAMVVVVILFLSSLNTNIFSQSLKPAIATKSKYKDTSWLPLIPDRSSAQVNRSKFVRLHKRLINLIE